MTPDEARELGRIAASTARSLTEPVEDLHLAILDRGHRIARRVVGPAADPVRTVHVGSTRGTYAAVRLGMRAAGAVGGWIGSRRADGEPHAHPRLHASLSVLSGITGDAHRHARPHLPHLHDVPATDPAAPPRRPLLHSHMVIRHEGRDIAPTRAGLSAAFPTATGRIVVFAHGLTHTERDWLHRALERWGSPDVSYGRMLEHDGGWTPLFVRYDTGDPIRDNGRRLGDLLAASHEHWPVPVEEVALVGHSMGGLVMHSALAQAGDAPWVDRVSTTVTLGSPHNGATLERVVAASTPVLQRFPETRWLSMILESRSDGIRDLADGRLLADGHDHPVPLRPGIRHCVVIGTVGRPSSVVSRAVGDLIVRPTDAGIDHRGSIDPDDLVVLGGLSHLALLSHPTAYEHLRRWLAPPDTPTRHRP